ncbi:transposase [Bradyrhizobium sp. SSUT112]|uniref:IS66 family transposase n=1 Tax=Bradyrhizobium sp. SSUT112 TaxID=3040604 RepID=UPI00244AF23F|nr:transposase [Bradyrhizobium sp. SSUT112]MDH2356524.1 transposase [Bradyrhizobium sp. SSUT112]
MARKYGATRWQIYDWRRRFRQRGTCEASQPTFAPGAQGALAAHDSQIRAVVRKQLSMISSVSTLAEDIRYALNHWQGLTRILKDGRLGSIRTRSRTPSGQSA